MISTHFGHWQRPLCGYPPGMNIEIRDLQNGDREKLALVEGGNGWNAAPELWAAYAAEHTQGRRLVVIAWEEEQPLGYGTLVWSPGYPSFCAASIPEINNLGVDVRVRRHGVATALVRHFEDVARRAGRSAIGLGVGLYADYGPAQQLYFQLGYRPDGKGITYADQPVPPGELVRLDDGLVLWLLKTL
jgi:GNAT superfamily N-acetyltransferase